jgi:DNA-binding NtrC family response regulator
VISRRSQPQAWVKVRTERRTAAHFCRQVVGLLASAAGTDVALLGDTMAAVSSGFVLVADDQPLIRWAIGTTIRSLGFEPVFAATQAEARALLGHWTFAMAVVADPMEERETGDLLAEIRRSGTARVIVLTESGAGVLSPEFPGAIAVEKPFSLESVITAVGTLSSQPG